MFGFNNSDSDRYQVRLNRDPKAIAKLTSAPSKAQRVLKGAATGFRRAVVALLVSIMAFMGMLAVAGPASAADPITDGLESIFCSRAMHGEGIIRATFPVPSTKDAKITMYEKYDGAIPNYLVWEGPKTQQEMDGEGSKAGGQLVTMAGGKDSGIGTWGDSNDANDEQATAQKGLFNRSNDCSPMLSIVGSAFADAELQLGNFIVYLTNTIYTIALGSGDSIQDMIGDVAVSVVTLLKKALWVEFTAPVIVIAALWMAWVGLVKRESIRMAQGAIWMFASLVAGWALMSYPLWIPNLINTAGTSMATAIVSQTNEVSTKVAGAETNYCKTGEVPAKSTSNVTREFSCTMWYSFSYTTWVQGQFGQSPGANDEKKIGTGSYEGGNNGIGSDIIIPSAVNLGNQLAQPRTWAVQQLDSRLAYEGSNSDAQDKVLLTVAANQLYKDNYNSDWKGDNSANRMGYATVGLVGAIAYAFTVVPPAFTVMMLNVGVFLLVLISPLVFLIGIHPGMGRRVVMGWLETIVGLGVKITVNLAYIGITTLMLTTLVTSPKDPTAFLVNIVFLVVLAFAANSYRSQIVNLFASRVNFGSGGMTMSGQNEGGKLGGFIGGLATGALSAGANKAVDAVKQERSVRKQAKKNVNESASNVPPRPKEEKDNSSTPAPDTTDRSAGTDTSTESAGSRKSGPFNPEEADSETKTTDGAGARPEEAPKESGSDSQAPENGAGGRPVESQTESAPETPKSDGAGDRPKIQSEYDDTPATRADRREQLKFERDRVRTQQLVNGVGSPSIIGAAAKGGVNGWKSGSVTGGIAAGAGAAQNQTERIAAENEAKRRAEAAQYEAERKASRERPSRSTALPPLKETSSNKEAPVKPKSTGGLPDLPGKESKPKGSGAGTAPK